MPSLSSRHVGAHVQVLVDAHAREDAAPLRHHGQALAHQVPRALAAQAAAEVVQLALAGQACR